MPKNYLYYGDNLDILHRYIQDETVDLIYLDPPFNSNQNYNILFAEAEGAGQGHRWPIIYFRREGGWQGETGHPLRQRRSHRR